MPGVCPRCNKNVYFAEEFRCCGKSWHKQCLNCAECSKLVEPGKILEHELKIYCKDCHRTLFGTKGYGYGGALVNSPEQAVLTPPRDSAVVVAEVNEVRHAGGWVSPRLLRSTQKLQNEVVFEPVTPTLSTVSWGGGFASGKQRSPRKVSAGFGSGAASGGGGKQASTRHESSGTSHVWKSRDNAKPDECSNYAVSASSYQTKPSPQISLRSTFSSASKPANDGTKSSHKPVSPSSVSASANIPRSGYKPKLSPFKSSAPSCSRCSKSVYQAELVRACGSMWHKLCFTCEDCNKLLDSSTLCERGSLIYCRNCYHKNYGPKGVGFGIGANLQAL